MAAGAPAELGGASVSSASDCDCRTAMQGVSTKAVRRVYSPHLQPLLALRPVLLAEDLREKSTRGCANTRGCASRGTSKVLRVDVRQVCNSEVLQASHVKELEAPLLLVLRCTGGCSIRWAFAAQHASHWRGGFGAQQRCGILSLSQRSTPHVG